jgi:small subunit ribosomal protein S20
MRSAVEQVRSAIEAGDYEQAQSLMPKAAKEVDKAARKNIIHQNKAARIKSRLMTEINELAA